MQLTARFSVCERGASVSQSQASRAPWLGEPGWKGTVISRFSWGGGRRGVASMLTPELWAGSGGHVHAHPLGLCRG